MTQNTRNSCKLKLKLLIIYVILNIIDWKLFIMFMKLQFDQLIIIIKK